MEEKKIELFVVFQEKLAVKMHEPEFKEQFLEPLLTTGVTDELLNSVIDVILEDDEVKELVSSMRDPSITADLKILLKKLIERFSKYKGDGETGYIG